MSPVRLTMRPRLRGDGGAYQIVAQAPEARECTLLVGADEPAVADDVRNQDRRDPSRFRHGAPNKREGE
jgi:hypothetical protein